MARWLWCFGPPNVVRQSPGLDDGQTAPNGQSRKQQAPRAVQLQAANSKAQKHVLFEAGGGQGPGDSDAAATDVSAALSQQLMAALKASRDMRINTELHGSSHSSITGYGWSSVGVGAPGPISPKVPDEDPIQQAVLQDQSDKVSQLPVISHSSLDMTFSKSSQAIAVVRIASHTQHEHRSSDGGALSSAAGAEDEFPGRRGFTSSMRVSMVCSDDGSGLTAGEPLQSAPQQQQQQPGIATAAKLEPVYLNKTVQTMLDCRDHEEYTFTMDKQLTRNPMLAMLFENCVQRLLAGKVTTVRQYTPMFSSPNSVHPTAQAKFVNLQINTCLFQDSSGSQRPALFLWYNAPSSQFDLTSQLKRNYMALASVPSMVAVIAMDGRVLQQNSSSVAYMGFAMGSKIEGTHLGDPYHTLQRLFVLDPDALDEMLTTLQEGKSWQGQLRVPPQLDLAEPCELSQQDEDLDWEILEDNNQNDNPNNNAKDDNDIANSDSSSDDLTDALSSPSPAAAAAGVTAHLPGAIESFRNRSRVSVDDSSPAAAAAAASSSSRAAAPTANSTGAAANSSSLYRSRSIETAGGGAARGGMQFPKSSSAAAAAAATLKPLLSGAQVSLSGSSISLPAASLRAGSCSLSSKMVKSRAMQMLFGVDNKKPWRHGYRLSAGSAATSRRPSTAGGSVTGAISPRETWSGNSSSELWHRVQANKFSDPVTGEDVILLISTDITQRVAAEKQLQQVLNAEHKLLEGIFPKQVLQALTKSAIRNHIQTGAGGNSAAGEASFSSAYQAINASKIKLALKHEQISIMFADIVGFTVMSKEVEPTVVMEFLNDLYTRFDDLLEDAGVYKVETIGDCYMVAGGLIFTDAHGFKTVLQSEVDPLHAHRAFAFAVAMLKAAQGLTLPGSGQPVKMRVGIHSGPCVSGVVGSRMPRFSLFRDSVNTASRMESSNKMPGTIHVSEVTRELIGGDFWQDAGKEEIKGKGLMGTFYFNPEATSDGSGLAAVLQKVSAVTCTPDK